MQASQQTKTDRNKSYGEQKLTVVDRFGVYLSKRAISKHIDLNSTARILDFGCGYEATLLRQLASDIGYGMGIDVSISQAAKNTANLKFIEGQIEDKIDTLDNGSFDAVFAISVIEHLWNPEMIIEKCYRLLKADGKLIINVPTWTGKRFLEFSAFNLKLSPAVEMEDHKFYYGKRDLWPLLRKAGFSPSKLDLRYHKFFLNLFAVGTK